MKSKKATVTLFLFYLLALAGIILFKTKLAFSFLRYQFTFVMDAQRSINLIPFGAMLKLNGVPSYSEIIYNGLAFVPFGVFICMLKNKRSFMNLFVPIILTSLFFEVAQYVFALGSSDITDVIANTLGGLAGAGIFFVFHRICKENVNRVLNITALVFEIGLALLIGLIIVL
jgi:glycopeptide antibiotics resistance protein